jgi:hypothetical protein
MAQNSSAAPHLNQPHPPVIVNPLRRSSKPPNSHPVHLCDKHPTCYTLFTTASHGSKDALHILDKLCSPASLLFDPRFTSRQRPSPTPRFRTFPPSPTATRLPPSLPSTISIQNLDTEESKADMDKRNPNSFQQLEKLGEGTYATVCAAKTVYIAGCQSNATLTTPEMPIYQVMRTIC